METTCWSDPIAEVSALDRLGFNPGREEAAVSANPHYSFQDRFEDLNELIREQGVKPVRRIEDLKSDIWPEDEKVDDFIAAVRAWRNHG